MKIIFILALLFSLPSHSVIGGERERLGFLNSAREFEEIESQTNLAIRAEREELGRPSSFKKFLEVGFKGRKIDPSKRYKEPFEVYGLIDIVNYFAQNKKTDPDRERLTFRKFLKVKCQQLFAKK